MKNKNINFGSGNVYHGNVNCVIGDNVTMTTVNGKVVSVSGNGVVITNGKVTPIGTVCNRTSEKTITCTAKDKAEELVMADLPSCCQRVTVTVDKSIDRIEAEVKAVCYADTVKEAKQALDKFSISLDSDGDETYLNESEPSPDVRIETEYSIRLPEKVEYIFLRLPVANLSVDGLRGHMYVKSNTGNVEISNCTAVYHSLCAETHTGNINIINCKSEKEAGFNIKTNTGNISLGVAEGSNGRVEAVAHTGNIRITGRTDSFRREQRVCGDVVFADMGKCRIFASTHTGNVR